MLIKKVYASSIVALDSSVYTGGGRDVTEKLQAVLDEALIYGGMYLVMDGAALIHGLKLHSNTTIECFSKDCGFFLAPQSNCSLLENADRDYTIIRNRNITLVGGTYNNNCKEQEHHVPVTDMKLRFGKKGIIDDFGDSRMSISLEFYGVENLNIRDITIRNQRAWAMVVANWKHVTMENIHIDLPDRMHAQNQDGLHFWGPGQFLTLRNIRGCAGDDFIALAPDENDKVSSITDVEIDGVFLDDSDQGIRLLSRGTGRLDRVTIKNVTGTYRSFGFYINAWFPDKSYGNFGNILFENIDLRQTAPNYDYTPPMLFRIGGNVECITFKNIRHHNPIDNRTLFELGIPFYTDYQLSDGDKPKMETIIIDGLTIIENDEASACADYIQLYDHVDNIIMRNITVIKKRGITPAGHMIVFMDKGSIGNLVISDVFSNGFECFIQNKEKISCIASSNIVCDGEF